MQHGTGLGGQSSRPLLPPPENDLPGAVVPDPVSVMQGLSQSIIDQALNCQILAGINEETARERAAVEEGLQVYRCDVRKLVAHNEFLKDVVGQQNRALAEVLQCSTLQELAGMRSEIEIKIRSLLDLEPPTLRHRAYENERRYDRSRAPPGGWGAREFKAPP